MAHAIAGDFPARRSATNGEVAEDGMAAGAEKRSILKALHVYVDPMRPPNLREVIIEAHDEWAKRHDLFINELADIRMREMLKQAPTHRYKGVAVTEAQYHAFMAAAGFEEPAK